MRSAGIAIAMFILIFTPPKAKGQSASAPSSNDSNVHAAAAQSMTTPNTSANTRPAKPDLQQMLKSHEVITTDDLKATQFGAARKFQSTEISEAPSRDPAQCDAECAAEAREELGMGPSQEGEWQAQLAAARQTLAADNEWRSAYVGAFDQVHRYCVFQDQVRKAPAPSGTDYQSAHERAKQEQDISDMNRVLGQGVSGAAAQMERLSNAAEPIEPVRAAIMQVLAARVLNQCPCGCDP